MNYVYSKIWTTSKNTTTHLISDTKIYKLESMEVINILRVSFYEYRPKTLKIQFEYDKLTVGKIKRIPGREYLENKQEGKMWLIPYHQVSELTKSFDLEEIHFDESIDINLDEKGEDICTSIDLLKELKLQLT